MLLNVSSTCPPGCGSAKWKPESIRPSALLDRLSGSGSIQEESVSTQLFLFLSLMTHISFSAIKALNYCILGSVTLIANVAGRLVRIFPGDFHNFSHLYIGLPPCFCDFDSLFPLENTVWLQKVITNQA